MEIKKMMFSQNLSETNLLDRAVPDPSQKSKLSKNKNIKILIVEDNLMVQFALKEMLSQLGYNAEFASDGKKALASYRSDYNLILMDIEIPGLNGIEVTQIIRSIEKNLEVTH